MKRSILYIFLMLCMVYQIPLSALFTRNTMMDMLINPLGHTMQSRSLMSYMPTFKGIWPVMRFINNPLNINNAWYPLLGIAQRYPGTAASLGFISIALIYKLYERKKEEYCERLKTEFKTTFENFIRFNGYINGATDYHNAGFHYQEAIYHVPYDNLQDFIDIFIHDPQSVNINYCKQMSVKLYKNIIVHAYEKLENNLGQSTLFPTPVLQNQLDDLDPQDPDYAFKKARLYASTLIANID